MSNCSNANLRAELFELFLECQLEVRRLTPTVGWRHIMEVRAVPRGTSWETDGSETVIMVPDDANARAAVFWSLFNNAFFTSPLWRVLENRKWGPAFCNAFRYFMEARLIPYSPWLAAVRQRMAARVNLSIGAPNPDLILVYCGKDYERFKAFWKDRQAHPNESLDKFFATHIGTTP